jgi:hypothetical protein
MRSLTCPCEAVFDADIPESVDLDVSPSSLTEIMNGTFLSAKCPECGTLVKPDLSVHVTSTSRKLDIQVVPELDRLAFYRGAVTAPKGAEVVIGYRELVERMRACEDGFSPQALEIIKYFLLARAEQENPEAEIVIEYAGHEADKLVFDIWGLKEGEAGILHIPQAMYQKTLDDLPREESKEPFSRIFSGVYRSIRILEADPEEE